METAHAQFRFDNGTAVYFIDPNSPWQRGTNENTNGLLHPVLPRGAGLFRCTVNSAARPAFGRFPVAQHR
jgi:IS30 family transposase